MTNNTPNPADLSGTFYETVRRSFVLNGKRYTVEHKESLPAGTYRLERVKP
jgi:hypothetical protein